MALVFKQASGVKGATVSTLAKAYATSTTASSYLLAWVLNNPSSTTLTNITDTLGNTWLPIASFVPENIYIYHVPVNNVSGGANTVTAHFNTNASFCQILIAEYTGQFVGIGGVADVCTTFKDQTTNNFSGNVAVTSFTDETVLGIGFWNGTGTLTVGSGFTQRLSDATNNLYMEDIPKSVIGNYIPTITSNNAGSRFIWNTLTLKSSTSVASGGSNSLMLMGAGT